MKIYIYNYSIIISIIFLLITSCFIPVSISMEGNKNLIQNSYMDYGYILYTPIQSKFTYLIDKDGEVIHTWESNFWPGESVYMLEDGNILRTIKVGISGTGGSGGGVQKITWDGEIIWDFRYYTDDYLSHHDIKPLPNGNVLMIAWESKTQIEAIQAGKDPKKINGNKLWPDHVIEVMPTGLTSGNIVWEWHVWDHLIQDYDATKDNYGIVADHPELIDVNFGDTSFDWLHTNSIDYNKELDQILLSVHNFNEIWIIDHSTTTEEAAGHTGGNSGKGGDLLYRWGNSQAYKLGSNMDQKLFGQHDAQWIRPGYPGEGNILIFNNGFLRPDGSYSSIDEIVPPVDDDSNYYIESGEAYSPEEQVWIYTDINPTNFYSSGISGVQRLPNGNTLICEGPKGRFFEVTIEKITIWEYLNPYPNPFQNNVFKIQYIPPVKTSDLNCEGSINWVDVKPGLKLYGNFLVENIGKNDSILKWKITSFPSWGTWYFNPDSGEGLKPEDGSIAVQLSVILPNEKNKDFNGYIRVENQDDSEDFDVIPVYIKTTIQKTVNIPFFNFLERYPNLFNVLQKLLNRLLN